MKENEIIILSLILAIMSMFIYIQSTEISEVKERIRILHKARYDHIMGENLKIMNDAEVEYRVNQRLLEIYR